MTLLQPSAPDEKMKRQSAFTIGVVIVAAGRGERAGSGGGLKQYRQLAGEAVVARTVRAFRQWNPDCPIVVVRHADDEALLADALGKDYSSVIVATGGDTRQDSVHKGLNSLQKLQIAPSHVFIHDAARPFVSVDLMHKLAAVLEEIPEIGAIPALPISETIKAADAKGFIGKTVPRTGLFRAQTPQGFPLETILSVHQRAALESDAAFTDDASLFEWAGLPVRIVEGDSKNTKLTYSQDFEEAERMLEAEGNKPLPDVRVGHGYDTHQLAAGDHVILCGIEIPHDRSLSGHSDADVGFHALTDALLATIGAGDIGDHFPPSDPQWKGAASDQFLRHAATLVCEGGGTITHCDVTLLCEAPKIGPHKSKMREAIAGVAGIDITRVSVKATTNERIGFVGRQEGIVALATATVVFQTKGNGGS
jgi:2-C-methyl-D-erythritol 4-phosphate cytidylyltransferase / 2-C-methyl-D-erythritol 2,4-cyclodiphosphate synthase